mmetsp:Transcript_26285/g.88052  ORF Transcript_26285/g.88052 Transcript_26285/m.88052 type:complete len:229 (-) Transcript_26285:493-1179(-)
MVCPRPRMAARPMITEAMAARTCWEGSSQSSCTQGSTSERTIWRPGLSAAAEPPESGPSSMGTGPAVGAVSRSQTPVALKAAAVRTSGSWSRSSFTKAGTSSVCVTVGPRASQRSTYCSATTYRTRHDLSEADARVVGSTVARASSGVRSLPRATQFSTARRRTESCSSLERVTKRGMSSALSTSGSSTAAKAPRAEEAARRTMGVSSRQSAVKVDRISARTAGGSRG